METAMSIWLNTANIYPVSERPANYDDVKDNNIGTIKKLGTDLTFKNINIQELLGDLYDEYEYFNIELIQVMTLYLSDGSAILNPGTQLQNKNLYVYMNGLNWVNSSFSQKNNCNLNFVHLSNLSNQYLFENNTLMDNGFTASGVRYYSLQYFAYQDNTLTFKKSNKNVNINIWLGSSTETNITQANSSGWGGFTFPHVVYKFNI